MKIVVADNIGFNESDWARLEELGTVEQYDSHSKTEKDLINRLSSADIGITLVSPITKEVLKHCQNLKMVSICATGYDHINLQEASNQNVLVSNVPGYANEAVAEHVYSMLLSFIREICDAHNHVLSGKFNWKKFQGFELKNKTMGIYGLGDIGTRVAKIAKAFGMEVLTYSRSRKGELEEKLGLSYVNFEELLKKSDVISIHAALNENTRNQFGRNELEKMKNEAIIINTARGPIINYDALASAIEKEEIRGACLDVFPDEPPNINHNIFDCDNVLFTPHSAFNTREAVRKCYDICIDNVEAFLNDQPINVVT